MVIQNASDKRSFVTRHIGGETLIVPVIGSVADLESIYVVNDIGARIWELLATPTTVGGIADAIAREYEVSAAAAAADVSEFVQSLDSRGLIQHLPETA